MSRGGVLSSGNMVALFAALTDDNFAEPLSTSPFEARVESDVSDAFASGFELQAASAAVADITNKYQLYDFLIGLSLHEFVAGLVV